MRRADSRYLKFTGSLMGCVAMLLFMAGVAFPQIGHAAAMGFLADDLIVICGANGAQLVRILPSGEVEEIAQGQGRTAPGSDCVTCDACTAVSGGDALDRVGITFEKQETVPLQWQVCESTAVVRLRFDDPQERGPPTQPEFVETNGAIRAQTAAGHCKIEAPA
ncbi:hypothetical protein BXY66_2480 [Shimia isoporae]|uniref:Uncharacterized protein n=1 Tax=Shimia isoporae TaxID=647720 RepID=A0A4V2Q257_9RHOB|nr:hypothetical protein [Shimia isoporae]TCL01171.1 hypothetical protein BXY66_2480 [Shimia isoporae]